MEPAPTDAANVITEHERLQRDLVLPGGRAELLSTQDQVLGAASGQSYLGCVLPAAAECAGTISAHAQGNGQRRADLGR